MGQPNPSAPSTMGECNLTFSTELLLARERKLYYQRPNITPIMHIRTDYLHIRLEAQNPLTNKPRVACRGSNNRTEGTNTRALDSSTASFPKSYQWHQL